MSVFLDCTTPESFQKTALMMEKTGSKAKRDRKAAERNGNFPLRLPSPFIHFSKDILLTLENNIYFSLFREYVERAESRILAKYYQKGQLF